MSSMRLLFVHNYPIWDLRSGGGQRVNHELATHAARGGHDVKVLHVGAGRGAPIPLEYDTVQIIESPRLAVNAVRVARAVRALARHWRPDAVHASSAEAGFVPRLLPAGVGLMATMHHPDPPPLPPLRWRSRPLAALADVRLLQNAWLHALLLRGSHEITQPSEWSRRALLDRGYVASDRPVAVVHNGVDEAWLRASAPAPDPPADLLFVGRLEEQKGVDVLLRAMATETLAGVSTRVVGAGPGDERYRRLAADLGIADRVRFDGPRDHHALRGLATVSRVFVLPSRHESFGMAILEAMAAGLPVVATSVGGVPEFARDEVNAVLVPPDDVAALASAVRRVLDDRALAQRLSDRGREVAEAHRWERITDRMLEHLRLACELARPIPPVARRPGAELYRTAHAWSRTVRAPRGEARPAPSDATRLGIVRFGFLGDMLLLDPLLAALEERFPGAAFDLVVDTPDHVPPWMARRPGMDVIPLAVRSAAGWARPGDAALEASMRGLAQRWRALPPDVVVFATELDGPVQRYLAARLSSLAPRSWRVGSSARASGLPFLHRRAAEGHPGRHEIDRLLSIGALADASSAFRLPRVPTGGEPDLDPFAGPTVVVHPGASRPQKRWMPDRFEQLSRTLVEEEGARVILVGTDSDGSLSQGLVAGPDGGRIVDRRGTTDLARLRDLLAAADLFVGNDSFPFHLAVALGRPTIVLAGPGSARYHDYPQELVSVAREPVVCSPRHGEECPVYTACPHAACMQAIRTESVVAACRRLLAAHS